MKRCSKCKESKPLDAFVKRSRWCKQCNKEYYLENKAARNAYQRGHYERQKAKYHRLRAVARAKEHGHDIRSEEIDRRKVYDEAGHRCRACAKPIAFEEMRLDHIKPLKYGGDHMYYNVQCLCAPCNNLKSDQTIRY